MITPTVGRKVWYRPSDADKSAHGMATVGPQPLDATIIAVWNDACVNLSVIDANGRQHTRLSAILWQDGDMPTGAYAEWMPYQVKQADKGTSGTVELETKSATDWPAA